MKNAIEINALEKKYDNFKLGELNLEIPRGLIIGLIGRMGQVKLL